MAESALQGMTTNPLIKGVVDKLPNILNVILVVILGYWASHFVWVFAPENTTQAVPTNQPRVSNASQANQNVFYGAQVANKNLFGTANAPAPEKTQELATSRLNLKLIGVLAHTPAEKALAIISSGSGKENVFGIGEKLPGNATLVEVYPYYIVIERQGRREKIELPKDSNISLASSSPSRNTRSPARATSSNQAIPPTRARQIRQDFLSNPGKVMNLVNISQERQNGKLLGYKVNPKGDPSLFYELGLQDGDVITAVNGIPISNQRALSGLRNAGRYDVTVLRGGAEAAVSVSFD
jgi:general secretion pathway protein C